MVFHEITREAVVLRIVTALVVGGLIGFERGMKNRPAGLRTYMLVCVGSCLVMMTNQYIYQFTGAGDPMRLGAQVVSGIGFLGAGTIIVTRHNQIKGLTTAAGLWASAGTGLALGIGFYEAAITAAVTIFIILVVLQRLDIQMHRKISVLDIYVEMLNTVPLSTFTQNLQSIDLQIKEIQFEPKETQKGDTWAIIVTLKSKKREDHILLMERIQKLDGIVYLEEL